MAVVILALSLVAVALKARSLFRTYQSVARWRDGGPTGSGGFHLRARAAHESAQIAPWHPVDAMTWAHSSQAKENFKHQRAATVAALRAAADAADYGDASVHSMRREAAAEREATIVPDLVQLGTAIVTAGLSAAVALT